MTALHADGEQERGMFVDKQEVAVTVELDRQVLGRTMAVIQHEEE